MIQKAPIYSDLNQDLETTLLTGLEPIYQSIYNLLNTVPGERLNLPTYGVNLEKYRFRLFSEDIAFAIMNEIISAIETWEPRVEIVYNMCKYVAIEEKHEYYISIVFRLINSNDELYGVGKTFSNLSKYKDRFNVIIV